MCCRRIQAQHDHLDREYREYALGALLSVNTRGSGKVRSFLHVVIDTFSGNVIQFEKIIKEQIIERAAFFTTFF